jgi:hypothetical protein
MVRLKVDIIVTRGTPAALAAKNATATILRYAGGQIDKWATGGDNENHIRTL